MNTQIRAAYFNALLADASYVEGLRALDKGRLLEVQLVDRLTDPLAKSVGAECEVVTQWTDPDLSGFSVTVFADSVGQQYISFRGTERDSAVDWLTDLDAYLASGLARRQVIAMVNWYLRASTPTDAEAVQVLETPVVDQLTGEVLARTTLVQGEGTLSSVGNYVVSGHSLGGHLTTVFSRLFTSRVISSHTYNGLGVGQSFPESFIAELETELGLGSTTWAAVDAKQKNYYAQHGISIATSDWWLQQRGERIPLFNEQGGSTSNHLMYKLADTLALYDVLGALDGGLSIADATEAPSPNTRSDALAGRDRPMGPLAFRALVELRAQELVAGAARYALAPGMQVSSEIHLGTRSILEYVLSPVQKAWHEAARER
jgi:hypothetical protein